MNLKETELSLGIPGTPNFKSTGKRGFFEADTEVDLKLNNHQNIKIKDDNQDKPPTKTQVVGWPPVRSYRKNMMTQKQNGEEGQKLNSSGFVKVCMDGAPYLRKVDLKMYKTYEQLSHALTKMFSSFIMGNKGMIDFMNENKSMDLLKSTEYVPTYEDKDGDWMLVGDVPWEMFVESCKSLRIMKKSEATSHGPVKEKCKIKA